MLKKVAIKYFVAIFAYLAVLYPLWVTLKTIQWTPTASLMFSLFPAFGLLAFSLLWLHAISGVFEPWLRKNFDFDKFVNITATLILLCLILHPLLLLVSVGFNFASIFIYGAGYIWLAIIGWLLLITYDIGKALKKKYAFFVKNWNKILLISTVGFLLTFFHSLALGHDLQSGSLRIVWIFYGTTGILATIYTYGIKRFSN